MARRIRSPITVWSRILLPLLVGQRAGLVQDLVGHGHLADVVQQRGGLDLGGGVVVEPHAARDGARQLDDVLGVLARVAVALEQGDRERGHGVATVRLGRRAVLAACDADATAALGARAFEPLRRGGQELGGGVRAVELGHADRGADGLQRPHARVLELVEDSLHPGLGAREVGLGEEDHELVGARTAGEVVGAHAGAQRAAGGREHLVADGVAVLRVHRAEAVDVQDRGAQRAAVPAGALDLDVQLRPETAEVEQPGDGVVPRLQAKATLQIGDLPLGVRELALEVLAMLTTTHHHQYRQKAALN